MEHVSLLFTTVTTVLYGILIDAYDYGYVPSCPEIFGGISDTNLCARNCRFEVNPDCRINLKEVKPEVSASFLKFLNSSNYLACFVADERENYVDYLGSSAHVIAVCRPGGHCHKDLTGQHHSYGCGGHMNAVHCYEDFCNYGDPTDFEMLQYFLNYQSKPEGTTTTSTQPSSTTVQPSTVVYSSSTEAPTTVQTTTTLTIPTAFLCPGSTSIVCKDDPQFPCATYHELYGVCKNTASIDILTHCPVTCSRCHEYCMHHQNLLSSTPASITPVPTTTASLIPTTFPCPGSTSIVCKDDPQFPCATYHELYGVCKNTASIEIMTHCPVTCSRCHEYCIHHQNLLTSTPEQSSTTATQKPTAFSTTDQTTRATTTIPVEFPCPGNTSIVCKDDPQFHCGNFHFLFGACQNTQSIDVLTHCPVTCNRCHEYCIYHQNLLISTPKTTTSTPTTQTTTVETTTTVPVTFPCPGNPSIVCKDDPQFHCGNFHFLFGACQNTQSIDVLTHCPVTCSRCHEYCIHHQNLLSSTSNSPSSTPTIVSTTPMKTTVETTTNMPMTLPCPGIISIVCKDDPQFPCATYHELYGVCKNTASIDVLTHCPVTCGRCHEFCIHHQNQLSSTPTATTTTTAPSKTTETSTTVLTTPTTASTTPIAFPCPVNSSILCKDDPQFPCATYHELYGVCKNTASIDILTHCPVTCSRCREFCIHHQNQLTSATTEASTTVPVTTMPTNIPTTFPCPGNALFICKDDPQFSCSTYHGQNGSCQNTQSPDPVTHCPVTCNRCYEYCLHHQNLATSTPAPTTSPPTFPCSVNTSIICQDDLHFPCVTYHLMFGACLNTQSVDMLTHCPVTCNRCDDFCIHHQNQITSTPSTTQTTSVISTSASSSTLILSVPTAPTTSITPSTSTVPTTSITPSSSIVPTLSLYPPTSTVPTTPLKPSISTIPGTSLSLSAEIVSLSSQTTAAISTPQSILATSGGRTSSPTSIMSSLSTVATNPSVSTTKTMSTSTTMQSATIISTSPTVLALLPTTTPQSSATSVATPSMVTSPIISTIPPTATMSTMTITPTITASSTMTATQTGPATQIISITPTMSTASITHSLPTTPTVPSTVAYTKRKCYQCGILNSSAPCSGNDIYLSQMKDCKAGLDFCHTDIYDNGNGNIEIYKRCVDEQTCKSEWLQQTSDIDACVNYGQQAFSTKLACHFCCRGDGCNSNLIPANASLYT